MRSLRPPATRTKKPALRSAVSIFTPRSRWHAESRAVSRVLHRALPRAPRAVEVHLITAGAMRELNRRWRGTDAPTTVLSFESRSVFPRPGVPRGIRYIGEIYLAPAIIKTRGEGIERYALHGLLHLLGYTHAGKRDTMKMEAKEREILSKISNT